MAGFSGIDLSSIKDIYVGNHIRMMKSQKKHVILTEGFTDRFLYSKFSFFSKASFIPDLNLKNNSQDNIALNRQDIIDFASNNENVLSIIDLDYDDSHNNIERVVNINYYSKENIYLVNFCDFVELKEFLITEYQNNPNLKYHKISHKISGEEISIEVGIELKAVKEFIDRRIKCCNTFIRFCRLKDLFVEYKKTFHKTLNLNYILVIESNLNLNLIDVLFDDFNKNKALNFFEKTL